jgi:hypothetical protein
MEGVAGRSAGATIRASSGTQQDDCTPRSRSVVGGRRVGRLKTLNQDEGQPTAAVEAAP